MKVGPIFGEAWSIYKRTFWVFTSIMMTVWLPLEAVHTYVLCHAGPLWGLLPQILGSFVGLIATGATIGLGLVVQEGGTPSYGDAMRVGVGRWGAMIWTHFLAFLIVLLGLVVLVIPGILLGMRVGFVSVVVIREGLSGPAAIKRSFALTEDRIGKVFEIVFLIGLILLPIMILFIVIGYLIGNVWWFKFLAALTGYLLSVYGTLVFVCAYPAFVRLTAGDPPRLPSGEAAS